MFTLARILTRTLIRPRQERLITDDGVVLDASGQEMPVDSLQGRYMAKASIALGILMILGGVLSITLGIVAIVKEYTYAYIGTGLWVGLLFHVSTGALGIVAGRIKHMNIQEASRAVNAFLVMCIVNICSGCAAQLILGAKAARVDKILYEIDEILFETDEFGEGVMYAFDVTFIIVSLVEGLFCLIGIIITSIATCCHSSTGYVTRTCVSTCTTTAPAVTVLNLGAQQQPAGYYPQQPPVYQPTLQAQPGMYQPPQPQAQPPMYQPVQQPSVHQPPQVMVPNNKI